ncbi:hypothetical protein SAMN04487936_10518 [Halobacillus dabanensis]|uniref:Uncharacterized protein n=1 Tax=Halobacillus dabanensis TaxID=240302 RepID=A0A1I3UV33_HALDA|nr:hypothetical protein SAMN04487936_10518 [Halobacillus dabanensis]
MKFAKQIDLLIDLLFLYPEWFMVLENVEVSWIYVLLFFTFFIAFNKYPPLNLRGS